MNRFKEQRLSAGYKTQADLAKVLFVNQTAVSQWERGVTTPSPSILLKLSQMYGVSTDYLLGNETPQKERTAAPKSDGLSPEDARIMDLLRRLSPENKRKFAESLEALSEPPVQAPDDQA
ncbi:MAG: helix-turn-helix domain-containing protein [Dysosmobacter sp.]|nr:helix-turn-helix domain-containing protein [Dysosmobacter sp.]